MLPAYPPGPTYIRELDDYLSSTRYPKVESVDQIDESAQPVENSELSNSPLQRGDMAEIQGPSGSGKTSLMLFFLMISILPETYQTNGNQSGETGGQIKVDIGGKRQQAVLLYMQDSKSPIERLKRAIRSHLDHCLVNIGMRNAVKRKPIIAEITKSSLSRLTVVAIPSPSDGFEPNPDISPYAGLYTALKHLVELTSKRVDGEIAMLAIDGLGDTFWQARWYREHRRNNKSSRSSSSGPVIQGSNDVSMDDLMSLITQIRKDLGCIVVVTNQAIWKPIDPKTSKTVPSSPFWAQHLPAPWPSPFQVRNTKDQSGNEVIQDGSSSKYWPLSFHITLSSPSETLRQFRADITLREVLREGGEGQKRDLARKEAVWKGLVRVPSGYAVEGEFGEFAMRVGADGISIE
jgi:energy-coupling factor transporter ATP-binding protein EcfA2